MNGRKEGTSKGKNEKSVWMQKYKYCMFSVMQNIDLNLHLYVRVYKYRQKRGYEEGAVLKGGERENNGTQVIKAEGDTGHPKVGVAVLRGEMLYFL